jgi:hypothetical protein
MHIYEYLFTAILILAILLAASIMIETVSEPSANVSEKEQLKVSAQKIMTQLLLDPGDPFNWGSNTATGQNDLRTFGLAEFNETTRGAYVLSLDKVLRLSGTCPLFISPSTALDLLNLSNEYGFLFELYSALNVNIGNMGNDRYSISINSERDGLPVIGANITARMYYISANRDIDNTDLISTSTNLHGTCALDFSNSNLPNMKVLFVAADYLGVHAVKVYNVSNVVQAYIIGESIFLPSDCHSRDDTQEILVTKELGKYNIKDVKSSLDAEFKLGYVEPSAVAILAITEDNSSLILAPRIPTLTYTTISGLTIDRIPSFAYSLERTVTIGYSTYVFKLYLWRMSW